MKFQFKKTFLRNSRFFLLTILFFLSLQTLNAQTAKLKNGEYRTDLNGVSHWYKIAGAENKTTPIVIIHGGPGGNVYNFERIAGPKLEKFATVVYYEQRGSGRSDAPKNENDYSIPLLVSDLDALRQKLGLSKIIPLGFSFGGELALEYAVAHPEAVEKLILQSTTDGDWERSHHVQIKGFEAITSPEISQKIRAIEKEDKSLEERWNEVWNTVDTKTVDKLLFHNAEPARLNRKLWEESKLKNTGQMYRALLKQPAPEKPLMARARAVRVPTLIIIGLYDRNVGVDAARDLATVMPDSKLIVFENSGHFPDAEETVKYVQAVRDFLNVKSRKK